jgi:hypothetical protein
VKFRRVVSGIFVESLSLPAETDSIARIRHKINKTARLGRRKTCYCNSHSSDAPRCQDNLMLKSPLALARSRFFVVLKITRECFPRQEITVFCGSRASEVSSLSLVPLALKMRTEGESNRWKLFHEHNIYHLNISISRSTEEQEDDEEEEKIPSSISSRRLLLASSHLVRREKKRRRKL